MSNVPGPSELKLQISITSDKTVLDLKKAIAQKSDVEAERQRLIYSGASSAGYSSFSNISDVPYPIGRVLKVLWGGDVLMLTLTSH